MRIAILTLPLHCNYGGIIQNYALQTVLKRMGHEVETINLKKELLFKKYDISFLKRNFKSGSAGTRRNVRRFVGEHLSLTPPLYNRKDILKYDFSRFDAMIVGSDQVWRVRYAYPDICTYYLDFIRNGNAGGRRIRKMAFAASFGTDVAEYTDEQVLRCGECIKDFDMVTVREDSALTLINDVYKWKCKNPPVQTLDPTMLLHKEDYVSLSSRYHKEGGDGGLFYYILDMTEEKRSLIGKIAAERGIRPFTVKRKSHKWYDRPEDRMVPPLEEWLQAFDKASYVFTDSFHGSVFSILFNKEFLAFGNKKRGMSRFSSLFHKFNLCGRLIYAEKEYSPGLCRDSIDWNAVNSVLDEERAKAKACLELFGR